MRAYDIIKKKRDGLALSQEEINYFIDGYVKGEIADYQASALCMAIYFRGMDGREITDLTLAMRDSGEVLDVKFGEGLRVDKHSTGGVGDKTSLVIAPIVASLGVTVAKMSGRGLGHTGGTVDKLESIEGFCVEMPVEKFESIVKKTGIAIVGQSATLAPADKKLYALRDVTATVDSIPLIASSIMSKKLAAGDDCIVLDVKTGSGSFMKSVDKSEELARCMVDIGKRAGKKIVALVTDMDVPLGFAIGNSLEVIEAIETLKGNGPKDLVEICLSLSAYMLHLVGKGSVDECKKLAQKAIDDGSALIKFKEMVSAQGGDESWIDDTSLFPKAKFTREVKADEDGYIYSVNAEGYGESSLLLGAGRNTKEDKIDFCAGITLSKKRGDSVKKGEVIATLYTSNSSSLDKAEEKLLASTVISSARPQSNPIVYKVVE
ncbi:MAG: pyrimidine-nucleoside phosphorylase [Clostridia bacterium]|nr:pyrimidine-nucleoside phosphorylase [Clostridia bacterium]